MKIVKCNYSQYSSRYDAFRAGQITSAFDGADWWLEHSLAVMRVLDRAQRTIGA